MAQTWENAQVRHVPMAAGPPVRGLAPHPFPGGQPPQKQPNAAPQPPPPNKQRARNWFGGPPSDPEPRNY